MDSSYLYETIVSDLTGKINSGEYQAGAKLPTEAELVDLYKVSRTTVIKAITDLKKKGYVVRFPKKGTFVAQTLPEESPAQETAQSESEQPIVLNPAPSDRKDIAFIIPTMSDSYALNLVKGISSVFHSDEYRLSILQSYDEESEEDFLAETLKKKAAGIILFPVDHSYYGDTILYIRLSGYPLVMLDRLLERINLDFVVGDNRKGGRLVGDHLYELGHRKIAFFTTTVDPPSSVRDRIRGIRDSLMEKGLSRDALTVCEGFERQLAYEENEEMIRDILEKDGHTAFVVSESGSALYLYGLLTNMGLRIPEDVSLVSFDNPTNDIDPFNVITHVDQSEFKMAQTAAEILRSRIEHKQGEIRQVVIEPVLRVCRSTGPVPAASRQQKGEMIHED